MKKVLYIINLIALLITLVAYLTIFGGMACQPFLGIIQLVSAILLTAKWSVLNAASKPPLRFYWVTVLIYGIGWLVYGSLEFTGSNFLRGSEEVLMIGYVFVVPMLIAIYFTWVTYILHKKNDQRELVSDTLDEELIRHS